MFAGPGGGWGHVPSTVSIDFGQIYHVVQVNAQLQGENWTAKQTRDGGELNIEQRK